jgi:hypothetical protein
MRRDVTVLGVLALVVAGLAAACRPAPEEVAADREEIRAMLEAYADRLSQAYAFTDASILEGIASQREIASVAGNIEILARDGQRLATDLEELQIEKIEMVDRGNAYVQTFEVWEIRVMDLGSERMISADRDQRNRVRYQLEKEEGRWRVLWRQRIDDAAPGGGGGGA